VLLIKPAENITKVLIFAISLYIASRVLAPFPGILGIGCGKAGEDNRPKSVLFEAADLPETPIILSCL